MPRAKKKNKKNKTLPISKKTHSGEYFDRKPLAVGYKKNKFFLLFQTISPKGLELRLTSGKSDTAFEGSSGVVRIIDKKKREEDISQCSDFRFSSGNSPLALTYVRHTQSGNVLVYAETKDRKKWTIKSAISKIKTSSVVRVVKKKTYLYFGDDSIKIANPRGSGWDIIHPPRVPHWNFFDGVPFQILAGLPYDDHFVVFYSAIQKVDILKDVYLHNEKIGEEVLLKVGVALFGEDAQRLLWQTELPIIEMTLEKDIPSILGIVPIVEKKHTIFRIYTFSKDGSLGYIDIDKEHIHDHKNRKQVQLKKWHTNPIISPTHLSWEKEATFNPTAVRINDTTHILYRALGGDGISRIGYAVSVDGLHIDERFSKPVYTPQTWFENPEECLKEMSSNFSFMYPSGGGSYGGWGGCEDPKAVRIGDKIYMTYVAHTGGWPTRTALTSILVEDFLNKKWLWSKPVLMSPPGVGSKSVVLFPEKINGQHYIFHRIWPNVCIDTVSDLEFGEGKKWLETKHLIRPRKSFWDSQKISIGSSPIKTKDGWLVIYNAVDRLDGGKYKIGAMLLDLNHPEKVLARSRRPILSPEEFYENDGKHGVAYPGGAIDINGILYVYYGGGDKVCCVATMPVDEIVSSLKQDAKPYAYMRKIK